MRECARAALRHEPHSGRVSVAAREELERCWQLIDEAGFVIDRENWLLRPGDTTRRWAERHVDRMLVGARDWRSPASGDGTRRAG